MRVTNEATRESLDCDTLLSEEQAAIGINASVMVAEDKL